MPDTLNKQALINLLIDSPLREPIKINLIDIVNNTAEPDLPKIYPTITKELEIFQKATDRRMKLADETIAKLGGTTPSGTVAPDISPMPSMPPTPPMPTPPPATNSQLPPTPLHIESDSSREMTPGAQQPGSPLSVPPLDLPPLPASPSPAPSSDTPLPTPAPLGATPAGNPEADEAALAEIQKELDSLKSAATSDAGTPPPTPPVKK